MSTYMANPQNVERKWYVIDAEGMVFGRLASQVASMLRGKHKPTFTPNCDCGDYIIRRSDGLWGYQLAVVIDDALSGVTEVVRGRDILFSTPRQIHLQKTLGFGTPRYAHIPLLMDANGRRLAKRDKDLDLTALSKAMTPQQILGMLAFSAGVIPENRPADLSELVRIFDWKNISREDIRLAYTPQAAP